MPKWLNGVCANALFNFKMVCSLGLFPAGRKNLKKPVDLRLSVIKLLGAKWLVEVNDYMKGNLI